MIAYCGLICDSCTLYLATQEPDTSRQTAMRIEIAAVCNEKYGMNLLPADVTDCDGCRADTGRIFSGCLACAIRKCAKQKDLESCAACSGYPCEILGKVFGEDPAAQGRLEELRKSRSPLQ